jgi:pimeloyl-ACP methyl ester carboxylesterase
VLTEKTFDTGTVVLNYAEGPPSGPPLVLLHGISANWRMYSLFLPFLLPRWQIYAMDSRGHGKSGHPGTYTLGELAADTSAFLEGVVGQPAAIVGMSQGGLVGIRVAARSPQRVEALVVGDSPLCRETLTAWWENVTTPEAKARRGKIKELIRARSSVESIVSEMAAQFPQMDAAWLRYVAKSYTQLDPEIFAFLEQDDPETFLGEVDSSGYLPKITCPVLLLQSALMTPEDGQRALKQLPNGYLVHFDNMGHLLHLEGQGYQVIATVSHFLESLQ